VGRGALIAGVALSLASVTGALAVFTDVATNGPVKIHSGPRAKPVDLRINALATPSAPCRNMSDDVTTPVLDLELALGDGEGAGTTTFRDWQMFCVQSVGTTSATVTMQAVDVVSREIWCTGVESQVDSDCAFSADPDRGDLYPIVFVALAVNDVTNCLQTPLAPQVVLPVGDLVQPNSFEFPISPGERKCVAFRLDRTADETQLQRAQSDRLGWRFQLTATDASTIVTAPPNPDA
jgi:hypothetical protein